MTETTFSGAAGEVRGYLAVPDGDGPWPGVVVIHEAYGIDDDTRRITDELASKGYLALAVDLFSWGGTARCLMASFRSLSSGKGRAYDDIEAARQALQQRDDCTGRIGVIGFCMGGGFALVAAPRLDFQVASANYGMVPKDAEEALAGACPIIGSYGERDRFLRKHVRRLESALTTLGIDHDVKSYPDASHGFLNKHAHGLPQIVNRISGYGHHGPSAEDAWRRIDAFFAKHLRD